MNKDQESLLVNHFGSRRGRESEKRAAKRDVPLDVVKVKLHSAPVGKGHQEAPDIKLGAYHH